jgi:hypothetical protein
VQSPIPGSQESLKTLKIKRDRNFAFPGRITQVPQKVR